MAIFEICKNLEKKIAWFTSDFLKNKKNLYRVFFKFLKKKAVFSVFFFFFLFFFLCVCVFLIFFLVFFLISFCSKCLFWKFLPYIGDGTS